MGICESAHKGKSLATDIQNRNNAEKNKIVDKENEKKNQISLSPSNLNQSEKNNSIEEEIKNNDKKPPELMKYERSLYASGKRSEYSNFNKTSIFSSGRTEEEIIIRGEINKDAKNKEEDFVNNSFKQLIKNTGGIFIKNNDINSNFNESQRTNPIFDIGNENISEIHSKSSIPVGNNGNMNSNSLRSNNHESCLSSNLSKGFNINKNNLIGNKSGGCIMNGKYNKNGELIPNENNNINKKINIKTSSNNNKLKDSNKVNISMHESSAKFDSYLNMPKSDQPLPDIDELSECESIPRNSKNIRIKGNF